MFRGETIEISHCLFQGFVLFNETSDTGGMRDVFFSWSPRVNLQEEDKEASRGLLTTEVSDNSHKITFYDICPLVSFHVVIQCPRSIENGLTLDPCGILWSDPFPSPLPSAMTWLAGVQFPLLPF